MQSYQEIRRVLSFSKPYRKEIIISPLFKMLEAVFELLVPLVMGILVDQGIVQQQRPSIVRMVGILIVFVVVGFICSVIAQYYASKAAIGTARSLRNEIFQRIMDMSHEQVEKFGKAALMNRIGNDVMAVQTGINLTLRLLLRSPFVVFGAIGMAFIVSPQNAWWLAGMVCLLFLIVYVIMRQSLPLYQKLQSKTDRLFRKTRENISGVRVIRAFHQEEREQKEFEEISEECYGYQKQASNVTALLAPLTFLIVNATLIVLLYSGNKSVLLGNLTEGELIALVNYLSQILVELLKFADLLVTMSKAISSARRLGEILQEPSARSQEVAECEEEAETNVETNDTREGAEAEITFQEVSFVYPGNKEPSLRNLSFSIKKGQTLGIIGATGSGKTTLALLWKQLYTPTNGNIVSYHRKQDEIAIVLQKATLFQGSVRSNLQIAKEDATDEEMILALKASMAWEFIKDKGLDYPVSQEGRNLSGGQKQRISIARALLKKSAITIFDDSCSALDYLTQARVLAGIDQTLEGKTKVFIAQRISTVRKADQILVMEQGQIVGAGSHEELLKNCSIYHEIYASQYQEGECP